MFGRVVAEETLAPIAGAQVKIAADIPASSLERTVWLRADQSNKEGRFRFDRLPAALYRLQVSAPGRLNQSEVGVAVTDEEIVIPMVASADIPCRVLVDTGDDEVPLPDRRVSLELPGEVWSLETQTDANGILLLAGISGAELAGDFRRIEVIVEGHADPLLERSVEEDEISWYGWTCQGVRLENRLYGPIRPPSSD